MTGVTRSQLAGRLAASARRLCVPEHYTPCYAQPAMTNDPEFVQRVSGCNVTIRAQANGPRKYTSRAVAAM